MSNENVIIDNETGSLIAEKSNHIQGVKKDIAPDNSLASKLLFGGKNNRVQQELDKIFTQVTIMTAIAKGNKEISTVIQNQQKQLSLDLKRIQNAYNDIMADLNNESMALMMKKLNELSNTYITNLEDIKKANHPENIEKILINSAYKNFMKMLLVIENLFSDDTQKSKTSLD